MKDINIVGQEFFATIEGNLDLIIDLFPLQYEKQKEVIAYIMEVLRDKELSRELQEGYFFWKNLCLNLR